VKQALENVFHAWKEKPKPMELSYEKEQEANTYRNVK
jgi:hypothetical protein